MLIYSFDIAIKNLGFCCIEVDENWRDKVAKIIEELYTLYDSTCTKEEFLNQIADILKRTNIIVSNIMKLKFINVIDLIPGKKVKDVKFSELIVKLKYILACIDKTLPPPDIVLIEQQMSVNDKATGVCRYVEEYYTQLRYPDEDMTYVLAGFPLENITIEDPDRIVSVVLVNPNLKNKYTIDNTPELEYCKFIEKYSNYVANKKHCVANFIHYMKKHDLYNLYIKGVKGKLDDIADSFCMAYAYLKEKKIID
jgi:hypothetical protein